MAAIWKTVTVLTLEPAVFRPHQQHPVLRVTVAVRMRGEASEGAPAMRDAIDRIDQNAPLFAVKSLKDIADDAIATQRFAVFLFASFAGVTLILATVGAYGVKSFLSNLRGREFAIRAALGATPVMIIRAVLRRDNLLKAGVRNSERRRRDKMSFLDGVFSSSERSMGIAEQSQPVGPATYRDPNDVRTIYQLLSILLITLALFTLSAIGNAWQYWR